MKVKSEIPACPAGGRNPKSEINNLKFNKGYSLIELLVVITLIAILGTLTAESFILGIKAQSKSEILKEVKQNSDYIGQVVESMVRNAIDIEETQCNTNTQTLTVRSADGNYTTFDCSTSVMASVSGEFPQPTIYLTLSNNRVSIGSCNFRVVCPTPPINPKYIFINFSMSQTGSELPKEQQAAYEYQNTISLRNYQ